MKDDTHTRFLNVDLEVRGAQELDELVRAFEPDAMALSCMAFENGYLANLELATQPKDAEGAIGSFVTLIEKLPQHARKLWDDATKRDFSIGVRAGTTPSSFELALTPAVLRLAADVGARVSFVVYVDDPDSDRST